jgi:hypothetical protein
VRRPAHEVAAVHPEQRLDPGIGVSRHLRFVEHQYAVGHRVQHGARLLLPVDKELARALRDHALAVDLLHARVHELHEAVEALLESARAARGKRLVTQSVRAAERRHAGAKLLLERTHPPADDPEGRPGQEEDRQSKPSDVGEFQVREDRCRAGHGIAGPQCGQRAAFQREHGDEAGRCHGGCDHDEAVAGALHFQSVFLSSSPAFLRLRSAASGTLMPSANG